MTTLILSPVLALTLVSATTAGRRPRGRHRQPASRSPRSPIAKPDLVDAVNAATPPPGPAAAAPAARQARRRSAHAPRPAVGAGPPADPNSVIGIIEAAAARWGVSG